MTLPLYRILGIILLCDGRCHFDICTRIRVLILLCPTNDGTIASRKRNVHRGHPRMASGYRNFDVRFTVKFLCTKPPTTGTVGIELCINRLGTAAW
jgi:hypothetical protein